MVGIAIILAQSALGCYTQSVRHSLPVLTAMPVLLFCSAFIVGALTPGIVALTAGRIAELVGTTRHQYYWG
ncbi:hypothetical protein ACT691_17740 [Vibrio metschnikovii]